MEQQDDSQGVRWACISAFVFCARSLWPMLAALWGMEHTCWTKGHVSQFCVASWGPTLPQDALVAHISRITRIFGMYFIHPVLLTGQQCTSAQAGMLGTVSVCMQQCHMKGVRKSPRGQRIHWYRFVYLKVSLLLIPFW